MHKVMQIRVNEKYRWGSVHSPHFNDTLVDNSLLKFSPSNIY